MASNNSQATVKRKRGRPAVHGRSKRNESKKPAGLQARARKKVEVPKAKVVVHQSTRTKKRRRAETEAPVLRKSNIKSQQQADASMDNSNVVKAEEFPKFSMKPLDVAEIKIETDLHCIFCLRKCEHHFPSKIGEIEQYKDVCSRYMRFVSEFNKISYGTTRKGVGRRPAPREAFDFTSCDMCYSMIQAFCDTYAEFSHLKLKLSWALHNMGRIMKSAEKVRSRQQTFQKVFEKSRGNNGMEVKKNLEDFRREFVRKCKIEASFPKVSLTKNEELERKAMSLKGDFGSPLRIYPAAPHQSSSSSNAHSNEMRESHLLLGDELSISASASASPSKRIFFPSDLPTESEAEKAPSEKAIHPMFLPVVPLQNLEILGANGNASTSTGKNSRLVKSHPLKKIAGKDRTRRGTRLSKFENKRREILRRILLSRGEEGKKLRVKLGLKCVKDEPETVDILSDDDGIAPVDFDLVGSEQSRASPSPKSTGGDGSQSPAPVTQSNTNILPQSSHSNSTQDFEPEKDESSSSSSLFGPPSTVAVPCSNTTVDRETTTATTPNASNALQYKGSQEQDVVTIGVEPDDNEEQENETFPPGDPMNMREVENASSNDQEVGEEANYYVEFPDDHRNEMDSEMQENYGEQGIGMEIVPVPALRPDRFSEVIDFPGSINGPSYEGFEPLSMPGPLTSLPPPGGSILTAITTTTYTEVEVRTTIGTAPPPVMPPLENDIDSTGIHNFVSGPSTFAQCFQELEQLDTGETRDAERNGNNIGPQHPIQNNYNGDPDYIVGIGQPQFDDHETNEMNVMMLKRDPIATEMDVDIAHRDFNGGQMSN